MSLEISVLIPTLGRSKLLLETLDYLSHQTLKPKEILVADQNQPSLAELETIGEIPGVRHLRSTVKGISLNYNLLLHESKTDVVLYLDDDVVPAKDLLERHLENYEKNKELGGVAGRVEQPEGDLDPSLIQSVGAYRRFMGNTVANFNARERQDVQFSQGCNMSFRREALSSIGGFDIGFDGNGYFFETDGGLRLLKAGYRIIFDPRAELKHLAAPSGGARVKDKALHTYYFVKNGTRLYRRHSPSWALPFFAAKTMVYLSLKGLLNRNLQILTRGLAALCRGLWEGISWKNRLITSRDFEVS